MMNIEFGKTEKIFQEIQDAFNDLVEEYYPQCLEWNHYELWRNSGKVYTPHDWKTWRLDDRVDHWYNSELIIIVQNRATKLLSKAGENKSVGESQALTQVMNFLDKNKQVAKQETKYIYSFVPLNINEEASENVKVLENIPTEIRNAISAYSGDKKTKK